MRGSNRAAIGVTAVWAAWAAGCVLPTGDMHLDAPRWCPSAGPGAVAGDCEGGSGDSFGAGSRTEPETINAVMTVVAHRRDGAVAARWRGPARWLGPIPDAGVTFTGAVDRGRVTWDGVSAQDVRVEAARDGSGGLPLRRWLLERAPAAARVSVLVTWPGVGAHATHRAARAVATTRDRLARSLETRLLSAAEQRQLLDDEAGRYNERLLRENLEAARRVQRAFRGKIIRQNEVIRDSSGRIVGEIDFETADALVEVGKSLAGKSGQLFKLAEIAKARGKRLDVLFDPGAAPIERVNTLRGQLRRKYGNRVRFIPFME